MKEEEKKVTFLTGLKMKRKGEKFDPPKNITRLKISTTLHERKAPPKYLLDKIFFHPISQMKFSGPHPKFAQQNFVLNTKIK